MTSKLHFEKKNRCGRKQSRFQCCTFKQGRIGGHHQEMLTTTGNNRFFQFREPFVPPCYLNFATSTTGCVFVSFVQTWHRQKRFRHRICKTETSLWAENKSLRVFQQRSKILSSENCRRLSTNETAEIFGIVWVHFEADLEFSRQYYLHFCPRFSLTTPKSTDTSTTTWRSRLNVTPISLELCRNRKFDQQCDQQTIFHLFVEKTYPSLDRWLSIQQTVFSFFLQPTPCFFLAFDKHKDCIHIGAWSWRNEQSHQLRSHGLPRFLSRPGTWKTKQTPHTQSW